MSDQQSIGQEACPNCGGALHRHVRLQITFEGHVVEAIEKMAERRKEEVGQFIFHLLWLESNKVPAARELLTHHEEGCPHAHEH